MTRESPVERVAALYGGAEGGRSFREDLEAHLLNGYVFSTPEVFAMGRAVSSRAGTEAIRDPWHGFAREDCDAWLVYAMAGRVEALLRLIPYPLPLLGWERAGRNGLRFLAAERFRRTWKI